MTQARSAIRPTGWLKPSNNRGNLVIEFSLNLKKYKFAPVLKGKFDNVPDYRQACLACEQIEWDIRRGEFDTTLDKYRPKVQSPETNSPSAITLSSLWSTYKKDKELVIERTTQNTTWKFIDKVLVDCKLEQREDLSKVVETLLANYSLNTACKVTEVLSAAINHNKKRGTISTNPLMALIPDLKRSVGKRQAEVGTTSRKSFIKTERDAIIRAFESDRFNPKSSGYKHSHYASFVKFRFYTGCRPEEAIALTWGDIKGNQIHFNKAYSKRVLKRTKNLETRKLPINAELKAIIDELRGSTLEENMQPHKLVFPAFGGGYICQGTFNRKSWKVVLKGLVDAGEILTYLPSYNARHTFVTMALEANVPVHVVAKWVGNTVEVLLRNYVNPDSQIQIPPLG